MTEAKLIEARRNLVKKIRTQEAETASLRRELRRLDKIHAERWNQK